MSVNKYVNGKLLQLSGNADTRLTIEDITNILGYAPANPSTIAETYAPLTYVNETFSPKTDIDTINSNISSIQQNIDTLSVTRSYNDSGSGNLITTENFLNHLIDLGIIVSGKYTKEQMIGTYAYASHYIISDSPIELHLTSCLIELFGRYDGSLSKPTNNFYMRVTTGMPSLSSRTSQRKRCFVFNASGGGSGWCELSNSGLLQMQKGVIYLNNGASGTVYYNFVDTPEILLSCNEVGSNVAFSYSEATATQAKITNNTGTTVGIRWVAIGYVQ